MGHTMAQRGFCSWKIEESPMGRDASKWEKWPSADEQGSSMCEPVMISLQLSGIVIGFGNKV
jgi:hypothetical protein